MQRHLISIPVGNKTVTFETGKIARQAHGAVLVRCGDTIILSTACASAEPLPDVDFLPLKVEYQEKFSSVGRTSGGFIKTERPSAREILVARLIDRPIRPMFEEGYYHDVQLLNYVWSYDGVHSPEPLAICAASAALCLSHIPLIKPIGAVRVGMIDGQFVINPTVLEQEASKLDLMMAGTEEGVLMIEGSSEFLTEEQLLEAISCGHRAIQEICRALAAWQAAIGRPKQKETLVKIPEASLAAVEQYAAADLSAALRIADKKKREEALVVLEAKLMQALRPKEAAEESAATHSASHISAAMKTVSSKYLRKMILEENIRPDGRLPTDIRFIDIEQGLLPRVHGSSLFTRGETQTMAVCTLGSKEMEQRYETLHGEASARFYLQYFFPPFSVGEVGRVGAPGRREIGHGKLAERALAAVLPSKTDFPYSIRVESNITESNGSSSMATVCGGCLAMMDAGVPLKGMVAGIAMGLILEEGRFVILSDILGAEDALGDMDFKVAGTESGITSFQMDIKVEGITPAIMDVALKQARAGRLHILSTMRKACPNVKSSLSIYAPRIETMQVKPSKIAAIIGPGGKQIRAIIEASGAEINIDDTGLIHITSSNLDGIEKAKAMINGLTAEVEIGRVYSGKVTSVVAFGLFVEILPGKEGLCHISEYAHERIETLDKHVRVGDVVDVKVIDINERGQLKLSRKVLIKSGTGSGRTTAPAA